MPTVRVAELREMALMVRGAHRRIEQALAQLAELDLETRSPEADRVLDQANHNVLRLMGAAEELAGAIDRATRGRLIP